jgi:hypothetical protein
MPKKRPPGRPPAGKHGQEVRSYPRLTLRLPPRTMAVLERMGADEGLPLWRVIDRLILGAANPQRKGQP